ncbi:unnamed protein product, partial [Heterosigma akashiwo]
LHLVPGKEINLKWGDCFVSMVAQKTWGESVMDGFKAMGSIFRGWPAGTSGSGARIS